MLYCERSRSNYTSSSTNLNLSRIKYSSLPGEIYENVLKGNLDYDWNNIKDKALIKVLQPKSFAQGIANIAYLNQPNTSISKEYKGYFIYYNPITKTGWFKPVEL